MPKSPTPFPAPFPILLPRCQRGDAPARHSRSSELSPGEMEKAAPARKRNMAIKQHICLWGHGPPHPWSPSGGLGSPREAALLTVPLTHSHRQPHGWQPCAPQRQPWQRGKDVGIEGFVETSGQLNEACGKQWGVSRSVVKFMSERFVMEFPPHDGGAAAWMGLGGYPLPKSQSKGKGRWRQPQQDCRFPRVPSQAEHPRHAGAGAAVGWAGGEEGAAVAGAGGNAEET